MNDNVLKFTPPPAEVIEPLKLTSTISDAFHANLELIRLQQIYPMLNTVEERENNLQESQKCLDVISQYIIDQYHGSACPDPAA